MILKVNASELDFLIENSFIKPNPTGYDLAILSKNSEVLDLPILINVEEEDDIIKEISSDIVSLKESYNNFYSLYPETDQHGNFPETRNLRNDTGKGFGRYKDVVLREKIVPDDILLAIIYDVYVRMITSKDGINNLKFLPQTENWLLDVGNIKVRSAKAKTVIETNNDFNDFYNKYLKEGFDPNIISNSAVNIYETL